jgi:hypothetical protein
MLSDLLVLQSIFQDLDAISMNVSYLISKSGSVNSVVLDYLKNKNGVVIIYEENAVYQLGDICSYTLSYAYTPVFISRDELQITINREAIIGYYN